MRQSYASRTQLWKCSWYWIYYTTLFTLLDACQIVNGACLNAWLGRAAAGSGSGGGVRAAALGRWGPLYHSREPRAMSHESLAIEHASSRINNLVCFMQYARKRQDCWLMRLPGLIYSVCRSIESALVAWIFANRLSPSKLSLPKLSRGKQAPIEFGKSRHPVALFTKSFREISAIFLTVWGCPMKHQ